MNWRGKLVRVDLGAGAWALEADGRRIMLFGDVPAHLAGEVVDVHGRELEDGASFSMTGDTMVEVQRIDKASASPRPGR